MPWGDGFDPSFCAMRESLPGPLLPSVVTDWPIDESVYGVRGLGGNVRDWCVDVWSKAGPPVLGPLAAPFLGVEDPTIRTQRVNRGGHFFGGAPNTWSVFRDGAEPSYRFPNLGFRLVRGFPGQAPAQLNPPRR